MGPMFSIDTEITQSFVILIIDANVPFLSTVYSTKRFKLPLRKQALLNCTHNACEKILYSGFRVLTPETPGLNQT